MTRAEAGLPDDAVVFCSFNQGYKIEVDLFDSWVEILRAVPRSVLWLGGLPIRGRENLRTAMRDRGQDPERIVFARRVEERARHLERIALADVALDTWTYGGHSTTVDALWAGVPVVTRLGRHFPSRVCASVLESAGLAELIADSADSYIAKARDLALDPPRRSRLRTYLNEKRADLSLFDGESFVRNLETLYRRIWSRHEQGLPPVSMTLP